MAAEPEPVNRYFPSALGSVLSNVCTYCCVLSTVEPRTAVQFNHEDVIFFFPSYLKVTFKRTNLCFDLFLAVLKVLLYLEVTIQRQRFILAFVSCVEEKEHITTNIRWFCFVKCQRRYDETLAWIYQRFTTR